MTIFALTLVFFLIMDPLGNVQSFISYLEGLKPKRQAFIIMREMLIALVTIIIFDLLGEHLFNLLDIKKSTAYLASGLILFLVAIKILFPRPEPKEPKKLAGEPFLVPLAIPMIAGPALLATVMLYADTEPSPWATLISVLIAWAVSCIILLFSRTLLKVLGTGGLTACEKLMGMILVLLAIQRILQGVIIFYTQTTTA
jgi:multiple antibiotic resistance protein